MTKKAKLYIKRIFLLIFAFALEGVLGFLLIDGIANHDLAESKVIILIIVLMLLIPLALLALPNASIVSALLHYVQQY